MSVVVIKRNNTYTVNDLFQWDTNREIEIYGLNLTTLPEIHFANSRTNNAIVKQVTSYENGVIKTTIPNVLLESASPILVFVCTYEGDEFISRYSFTINVKARPKPADYIAGDEEKIYSYNALENLINNTLVNLRAENNESNERLKAEVLELLRTTSVGNADALDGYDAEDFTLESKPGTTVFNLDGSITTTYDDGSSETVVFNTDGSITTTRNTLESGVKTETVKFNANGSITVTVA